MNLAMGTSRMPSLPQKDEEGNVPALEFVRALIARDIIRERKPSLRTTRTNHAIQDKAC